MIPKRLYLSNAQKPKDKLATVTQIISTRPYVTFDDEGTQSPKLYAYQTGLTFTVGNRVYMQRAGNTYIIAYKITQ